jgi:hypothetical protein
VIEITLMMIGGTFGVEITEVILRRDERHLAGIVGGIKASFDRKIPDPDFTIMRR